MEELKIAAWGFITTMEWKWKRKKNIIPWNFLLRRGIEQLCANWILEREILEQVGGIEKGKKEYQNAELSTKLENKKTQLCGIKIGIE